MKIQELNKRENRKTLQFPSEAIKEIAQQRREGKSKTSKFIPT